LSTTIQPGGLPFLNRTRPVPIPCPQCQFRSTHVEAVCRRCNAPLPTEGAGVWRKGKRLVARKGATLPNRCVLCNGPSDGGPIVHKLTYVPAAAFLLIFLWLIPFIIVALLIHKKTTLTVSLCAHHHRRRHNAKKALIWVTSAGMALYVVAGGFFGSFTFGLLGLVILLAGPIWWLWGMKLIHARKIDDHFVYVGGVNRDFLAALPDWTRPGEGNMPTSTP
jgi:hypothetical protein